MTGGGFGGSTVHLIETDALEAFNQKVVQPYMQETGLMAPVYLCRAVAGVGQIPLAELPGKQ
jgi:galactokinase